MPKEDLQKFCRLVLEDLEMQDRLKGIEDGEDFINAVLEISKNAGFDISSEDVRLQIRETRRLWIERWI